MTIRHLAALALLSLFTLGLPGLALAQVDGSPAATLSTSVYEESFQALVELFVLAILIENALAVLFNWSIFLTYFNVRGIKTIIMVVVSYLMVETFNIDTVGQLFAFYSGTEHDPRFSSQFLTALILSGGSSGVHSLMRALGYRDRDRASEVNPRPGTTKAWIAVHVQRASDTGPVHVSVSDAVSPPADLPALAGTIGFKRPSLLELMFQNANRFPGSGGYELEANKAYRICVTATGEPEATKLKFDETHRFAPGAIVDFEVRM